MGASHSYTDTSGGAAVNNYLRWCELLKSVVDMSVMHLVDMLNIYTYIRYALGGIPSTNSVTRQPTRGDSDT